MSTSAKAFSRLRTPEKTGPLSALVTLGVTQLFETPLNQTVDPSALGQSLHRLINAWVDSPAAESTLLRFSERIFEQLSAHETSLDRALPTELRRAFEQLLARPFSPNRAVVMQLIDHEPMRELVRQLLVDTLLQFGKRASAPVSGVAKSLGGFARLAQETLKNSSDSIGGLVGAVSSEVERQLEKRVVEFVDTSLSQFFKQLADIVSDPARAHESAEVRQALFQGALDLTFKQLASEWVNLDVVGGARLLRQALNRWLMHAESEQQLERAVRFFLAEEPNRTMKSTLESLGLYPLAFEFGHQLLLNEAKTLVDSPGFESWWTELFEGS